MVADRIEVPLDLDDFEVVDSRVEAGQLVVRVRSTFPRACFHCGSVDVIGHGRCERRIRDRSCGQPTVLVWEQRRFRCRACGRTSRERHPEIAGRRAVTCRLRRQLFAKARHLTFLDVARLEAVSHYRVVEAFDHHSRHELASEVLPLRVLGIDESAYQRPFRYHTVLYDPEAATVIGMAEERSEAGCREALGQLPVQVRAGIETVTIDCHWPYRRAIEAVLPHTRIVADKFHVVRSIDAAAQRVRQRFGRKPRSERIGRDGGTARQNNPRNDPRIYRARWTFMKRAHALTDDDRERLNAVFATAPEIQVAYWLKEAFAAIYDAADRTEAEHRLSVWEHNLPAAGLTEFTNTWRTLSQWREPILNYFDDRQTNAFAEGATNKIKVIKRSAYGFRNEDRYRRKVLLACRHRRRSRP